MCTKFLLKNLIERDHPKDLDLDIDEMIILK
jgi:hypothetical protein